MNSPAGVLHARTIAEYISHAAGREWNPRPHLSIPWGFASFVIVLPELKRLSGRQNMCESFCSDPYTTETYPNPHSTSMGTFTTICVRHMQDAPKISPNWEVTSPRRLILVHDAGYWVWFPYYLINITFIVFSNSSAFIRIK